MSSEGSFYPQLADSRPVTTMSPPEYEIKHEPRMPSQSTDGDKIVMILLILLLPPVAIYYKAKECNGAVCLNILLMFLFVIPALCHAVWYCYIRE